MSTIEPVTAEPAPADEASGPDVEPLTVGNGSQVIAVTINLNIPILGPVVYAARRSMPPAVGGRIFDVVRRVVGGPGPASGPEAEPAETPPVAPDRAAPTDPSD